MKNDKHRNTTMHSAGGFTRVEVLLVVAIIGILATVVVVGFGGLGWCEGKGSRGCLGEGGWRMKIF